MRSIALLGLAVLAAGCAELTDTGPSYSQILQGWVGSPEQDLIDRWGAPDQVQPAAAGGRDITFVDRRVEGQTVYECFTTFTVDASGTLADYSYDGNDC